MKQWTIKFLVLMGLTSLIPLAICLLVKDANLALLLVLGVTYLTYLTSEIKFKSSMKVSG